MRRLFFVSFVCLVCCSGLVLGVECGSVPVDGCVVSGDVTFDSGTYYLASGISIGANGVVLDCGGAELIGAGVGNGIYNLEFDNIEIRNCNVKNYSNGIYFFHSYHRYYSTSIGQPALKLILSGNVLEGNNIGFNSRGHSYRYQNGGYNIFGNIFRENNIGVSLMRTFDVEIFGNDFSNNSENGVLMGDAWNNLVYGNNFNVSGIKYTSTNNNKYCLNESVSNSYENGAWGPGCGCLPLINGLSITSNEVFCDGKYYLPSGISIGADNVILDCGGISLIGGGSGDGIYNQKFDNVEIRNCNIKNYTYGIRFYFESGGFWGSHWGYSPDNCLLSGNVLEQNHFGLGIYGYNTYYAARNENVSENIFLNNTLGIEINNVLGSYLYRNKFLLNEGDARDFNGNFWNSSAEGNYWDKFDEEEEGCFDLDRDFVCDDVYNFSNIFDYFPLIDKNCFGKINVFVEDSSGNAIEDAYIHFGDNWNVSGEDGYLEFETEEECGGLQDVVVLCGDNLTVCGKKSSVVGFDGDVDSMNFVCDVCRSGYDVFVSEDDLRFRDDGLDVLVHSVGVSEEVEVFLIESCGGVKRLVDVKSVDLEAGKIGEIFFEEDFFGCEKVDVLIEVLDGEDYAQNNFVRDFFVIEPLKVYLEVDSGLEKVDEVIEEFFGEYVEIVSRSDADLEVYVGKKVYSGNDGYLVDGLIRFDGKRDGLPWDGVVDMDGSRIFVFGNGIEGTIEGVRKLIEGRERYLNGRGFNFVMSDVYFGGEDLDALSVFDYLHSEENAVVYMKDGEAFGEVVGSILRRDNFNLAVKRVLTNGGVSLRLKNLNFELSEDFRSVVDLVGRPVVMAGGLFSDLTMWEDGGDGLAFDLARSGKDVWEIEITGGPGEECDSCADYTYEDLVDSYWPALVGAVQYYSGDVTLDYVGHSNGCRAALSSLNSYQESGKINAAKVVDSEGDWVDTDLEGSSGTPIVDTFIGVACPAELNDETAFSGAARENTLPYINAGDAAMSLIFLDHVELRDYTNKFYFVGITAPDILPKIAGTVGTVSSTDNKISRNLMDFYNDLAIEENSDFDVSNLEVNKLRLHYGRFIPFGGDGIVPTDDSDVILNSVNSVDKDKSPYNFEHHTGIKSDPRLKSNIIEELTQ